MYNNFLSKKSKKAISALLATALVVTAAPINNAEAATAKTVGVKKTTTVTQKSTDKVTGLSAAEKKVVKVTKKGKKFTIKGLKAGKVSFKIGKKSYTVKVGTTSFKKVSNFSLTAGKSKTVSVTANNGAKDTLNLKSSNTKVATVAKTAKANSSKKASVKVTAKKVTKKQTATITVTSKYTGKKTTFKVTVNPVKATTTATPAATTNAPVVTTPATTTEAPATTTPVTATATPATPSATASVAPATTAPVSSTAAPATTTPVTATATPVTSTAAPATTAPVTPSATPSATPEVVTGGTITVSGAAVSGAAVTVISGTAVVYEGTVAGLATEKLEAGTYTVVITKEGYDKYTTSAVVTDGNNTVVNTELVESIKEVTTITTKQIGASKIEVTFDQPVTATTAAVVAVKTGSTEKAVSSKTWEDNKTLVLTMNEKLTANDYVVSVDKVAENVLTSTLTAVAEKADKVTIDNTTVAFSTGAGDVEVTVRNQFGEDMKVASGVNVNAYNKTQGVDDTITAVYANGKATLTSEGLKTKVDDVILLTVTYGQLPVVSGEVKVVLGKVASSVELGTMEKTSYTDEALLMDGDTFKLPIKITDQYGDAMKLATGNWTKEFASDVDDTKSDDTKIVLKNGTIITTSDKKVVDLSKVVVDANGVPTFKVAYSVPASGSKDAETATINVLIPSTGKSASYVVNTYAARKATALTGFSEKGTNKLAAEKTLTEGEQVALNYNDFTYADQYGEAYEASKAALDTPAPAIKVKDAKATGTSADADAKPADTVEGSIFMAASTFDGVNFGVKSPAILATEATFETDNVYLYAGNEGTEEVTFTLGTSKLTTKFNVNAAVTAVVAKKDTKTKYTAGDEVEITLTAQKNDASATGGKSTNVAYNKTNVVKFTVYKDGIPHVFVKNYNKSVTFVNGVATVKIPVTLVGQNTISFSTIEGQSVTPISSGITVEAAAFSKYVITDGTTSTNSVTTDSTGLTLTAQDAYGNPVTTKEVSSTLVKVTAKDKNGVAKTLTGTNIDSDGFVAVTDKAGVVKIADAIGKDNVAPTDVITVTVDGVDYTVAVVAG